MDAACMYYGNFEEVGTTLGKELVRGLLAMGESDRRTEESDELRAMCRNFPILGADIARSYLEKGIKCYETIGRTCTSVGCTGNGYCEGCALDDHDLLDVALQGCRP